MSRHGGDVLFSYLSRATTASALCGLSSSSIITTACHAGTEENQRWTKAGICVSEAPMIRSIQCPGNSHATVTAADKPQASDEQTRRRCAVFLPVPSDNGKRPLRTSSSSSSTTGCHAGTEENQRWTKAGICVSEAPMIRSIRCPGNSHATVTAAYKPQASDEQTRRRCAVFLPVPSDNGERPLRTQLEQQ